MEKIEFEMRKFIARTHRGLHRMRIMRELKIVFASLSVFGGVLLAILSNQVAMSWLLVFFVWLGAMGIVIFAFVDGATAAEASRINQDIAHAAEDGILDELNIDKPGMAPRQHAWIWEMAIIILAGTLTGIIVTARMIGVMNT